MFGFNFSEMAGTVLLPMVWATTDSAETILFAAVFFFIGEWRTRGRGSGARGTWRTRGTGSGVGLLRGIVTRGQGLGLIRTRGFLLGFFMLFSNVLSLIDDYRAAN